MVSELLVPLEAVWLMVGRVLLMGGFVEFVVVWVPFVADWEVLVEVVLVWVVLEVGAGAGAGVGDGGGG